MKPDLSTYKAVQDNDGYTNSAPEGGLTVCQAIILGVIVAVLMAFFR